MSAEPTMVPSTPISPKDGLLTSREFAALLGVSVSHLHYQKYHGLITPAYVQGKYAYWSPLSPEELEHYKERFKKRRSESGRKSANKLYDSMGLKKRGGGKVSKSDLADLLGVKTRTLDPLIKEGVFTPSLTRGAHTYFDLPSPETVEAIRRKWGFGLPPLDTVKEGLLTRQEMAQACGVSVATLTRWQKLGDIPGPCVYGPKKTAYFRPPTPEELEHARAQAHKRQSDNGLKMILSNIEKRKGEEGLIGVMEASRTLGISLEALHSRIKAGLIAREGRWIRIDELERYIAAGKPTPPKKERKDKGTFRGGSRVAPAPKAKELPSFTKPATQESKPQAKAKPATKEDPRVMKSTPLPESYVPYQEAVDKGRQNPAWRGPLGFNLLRHAQEGFRPAPVSEVPSAGWAYHERHFINGFKQWAMRPMKPSGEVCL